MFLDLSPLRAWERLALLAGTIAVSLITDGIAANIFAWAGLYLVLCNMASGEEE